MPQSKKKKKKERVKGMTDWVAYERSEGVLEENQ